jgi:hypothetical protein
MVIKIFQNFFIISYLNFPKTDSEYIQWIKFSKDIFSDEFLLGCVYIPPENSKYSTIDAFTEIENEFISLLGNNSRYDIFHTQF